MAGIPFLSKILALAGIGVRNQTENKEVLINVSPSQTSGTTVTVDLPAASGQLALVSEVVLASEKGAINGVATLDAGGKIPSTQLPPIAITHTFVVASQAEMLALDAQVGDIAIRTDINETFILQNLPASTLSNWIELLEQSGVVSVNGETGPAVVLDAADVGAVAKTGDTMSGALTMGPTGVGAGDTGQIAFRELAVNGIYAVTLRAPDQLPDNVTLTLPTSHGSNGQVLTSDGSGALSWSTPAADSVTSVNGQTGVVVLTAADVGAVAKTGDTMSGALIMGPSGILSGQTGKISFRELAANGTHAVSLIAPDSVAASYSLTLPATDGSAGQALITNGSGVLSWTSFPADAVTSVNGETGVVTLTSTNIAEGTNLYFTDARAQTAAVINNTLGNETNQAASVAAMKAYIGSISTGVSSVNGQTGVVSLNSDNIPQGSSNLYFTNAAAQSAAVVNSTAGSETNQAPSVQAVKDYVASSSPVLSVNSLTGVVSLDTGNVPEGTNSSASWTATGSMITARQSTAGVGTQSAALAVAGFTNTTVNSNSTEKFNGSSWSATTDYPVGMNGAAAAGSQSSALVFGGYISPSGQLNSTYKFDGSSWAATGNLNTARNTHGGCGTQNSALAFGGNLASTGSTATAEKFNGTTWSTTTSMGTARASVGGVGSQNAALAIGGYTPPNALQTAEKFNGSSWSATGSMAATRQQMGAAGTQTAALAFAGLVGGSYSTNTEKFNGSIWSTTVSLSGLNRVNPGEAGTQSAALSFGGNAGSGNIATTEKYIDAITSGLYFTDARAQTAAVVNTLAGSETTQAPSVAAVKSYISSSSPVLSVNGETGIVSLDAADVGAVAKAGDTMTGALIMGPIGTLSGQGGVIKFQELAANGTDTIAIRAPDSLLSSVTLTLPSNAGAAGQYLTTNGSGVLSWTDGTDSALSARVDKLELSRGIYTGTLNSGSTLNIASLVDAGAVEYPIVQIYKVDGSSNLQINIEFSFNPTTKVITFGEVADGPINVVIHVVALTAPLTTL